MGSHDRRHRQPAVAPAAGKKAELVRMPRDRILRSGGHPMGPRLYFGVYLDLPPITQVVNKAQRVLSFRPTDFAAGLKETYRWYLRHNNHSSLDYSFDDRLLRLSASAAAGT